MKNVLILLLAGWIGTSCVSSTPPPQTVKLARAIQNEGEIFLNQGKYTAALTKLLEAEKMIPNDPYLHNSLGLAYMGKKRYDLAEKAFKKALSIKPNFMEATNNLGAAYLRQKKWDLAIDSFESLAGNLLYLTPHFPLSNIGWAYMGKKDYGLAESYFLKALDARPWFVTASHGLAQVYMKTGRLNKAQDYLETCIQRNPAMVILHADLAEVHEARGNIVQAKRSWKTVQDLAPATSRLGRQAERKLTE